MSSDDLGMQNAGFTTNRSRASQGGIAASTHVSRTAIYW